MTFGEKIQKLRKEAGLSQEELSYQLGVSRQAVSKWERDSGYPETEKIIRMSKLFHVTLDYLLNEDTKQQPADGQDEAGFYVSAETAEGFLSFQKRKLQKTGIAIGLFIGGLAFTFWDSEAGILLYMLSVIIGILLLFSIKLSDHPYHRLWKEPLLFDDAIVVELGLECNPRCSKAENTCLYSDRYRADRSGPSVPAASRPSGMGGNGFHRIGRRHAPYRSRNISVHLHGRTHAGLPASCHERRLSGKKERITYMKKIFPILFLISLILSGCQVGRACFYPQMLLVPLQKALLKISFEF